MGWYYAIWNRPQLFKRYSEQATWLGASTHLIVYRVPISL